MRKIKIRRVSYVHVLFVINETGVLIVVTKIDFTCHVMDKNITILEQQPARSSDHLSRLYIYYSLSFYGESAATIQHLGLGELPLVRAIASLLAI